VPSPWRGVDDPGPVYRRAVRGVGPAVDDVSLVVPPAAGPAVVLGSAVGSGGGPPAVLDRFMLGRPNSI